EVYHAESPHNQSGVMSGAKVYPSLPDLGHELSASGGGEAGTIEFCNVRQRSGPSRVLPWATQGKNRRQRVFALEGKGREGRAVEVWGNDLGKGLSEQNLVGHCLAHQVRGCIHRIADNIKLALSMRFANLGRKGAPTR